MGLGQLALFRLLPALALLSLGLGLVLRLRTLRQRPDPWRMPLTPGSDSLTSHLARFLGDQFLLHDFLSKKPWHWALWAATHLCLFILLLRHLRLILDPAPQFLLWLMPLTTWAGYLLAGLLVLRLVRRMVLAQLAFASRLVDYLLLLLLLVSCISGLCMRLLERADLWAVKSLLTGLWSLDGTALPWPGGMFIPHYLMGLLLIALLPFWPLNHYLAPVFNSIRRMRDTTRRKRHHNPWDHEYGAQSGDAPAKSHPAQGAQTIADYRLRLRAGQED